MHIRMTYTAPRQTWSVLRRTSGAYECLCCGIKCSEIETSFSDNGKLKSHLIRWRATHCLHKRGRPDKLCKPKICNLTSRDRLKWLKCKIWSEISVRMFPYVMEESIPIYIKITSPKEGEERQVKTRVWQRKNDGEHNHTLTRVTVSLRSKRIFSG